MFKFVKKMVFIGLTILSNFANVVPLRCILMNNQECKVRPEIINVNSNRFYFILLVFKTNKCGGSFNNINNPMQKYVFLML